MKKATRILVPILLILLILASIAWYLFIYDRAFTRDSLLGQARFQDSHGNAKLSSMFYNLAYDFSDKDEHVAIELANQYKADGNYTKAEYTLTNAINSGATVELYTALCRTYVEQNKLLDAVNMLDNITDPAIKADLDALRPMAPAANQKTGFYNQYIDVQLSSNGKYLFYTTDGDYPSTEGPNYSNPIPLSSGETVIYAISVADTGLVSPLSILSYTINGVVEPVVFTDAAMEAALRQLIGADADDVVYTNQLWEIKEFLAPEGVATFADLKYVPHLTSLTIEGQTIDSLTHLASLGTLEKLNLIGCRFPAEELEVLSTLSHLTSLTMNKCGLSTIAGLEGATQLTYLDLNDNTLRSLTELSSMTNLRELYLRENAVTDLSYLSGLTNLSKLDVYHNSLTTLAPLASCQMLTWLDAGNNDLTDLSGVNALPLLSSLFVGENNLTDVSSLAACTELTELDISKNSITDIQSLGSLGKLVSFNFSYNQIEALPAWPDSCPMKTISGTHNLLSSISSLKNLSTLTNINMDYNAITNIDALADIFCLVQVNVYGNEIEDVSKLRERDIIVNYDPT